MRFATFKKRQPPAIIIISLIDILIVLLIFLMVTTTFKQQPAIKLALPESKQGKQGGNEGQLIVTIAKSEPFFYLGPRPVTYDRLQAEFNKAASANPGISLAIRADTEAPVGQMVKVMDAAKAANIKEVGMFTKQGIQR
jgi:biopolymer transport protein ExbD